MLGQSYSLSITEKWLGCDNDKFVDPAMSQFDMNAFVSNDEAHVSNEVCGYGVG